MLQHLNLNERDTQNARITVYIRGSYMNVHTFTFSL
jgi:hypothetical protein